MTTSSPDVGSTVAFDSQGNVFVAGTFQGAHDFGAGLVTSVGSRHVHRQVLVLGRVPVGATLRGGSVLPLGIATDANGDVYVAGRFRRNDQPRQWLAELLRQFRLQPWLHRQVHRAQGRTRARSAGSIAWERTASTIFANALTVTASGEVLVTGEIGGTVWWPTSGG